MKDTSIRAWYAHKASGKVVSQQAQVVGWLLEHGKGAQFEVEAELCGGMRSLGKRFSELERAGVVRVSGTTRNPTTRKECAVYELTGRAPFDPEPRGVDAEMANGATVRVTGCENPERLEGASDSLFDDDGPAKVDPWAEEVWR